MSKSVFMNELSVVFLCCALTFKTADDEVGESTGSSRENGGFQFPVLAWQLTTVCHSYPRGSNALFWLLWGLHTHDMHASKHGHKIEM